MLTSRRSLLAACASASLAGCLFGDAREPEGGVVGCDEVTHTPQVASDVESATGSWPTAHFDTRNTGYTGRLSAVTGCPRTQWRYGTETGPDRVGNSAGAVVADGRAYHVGGDGTPTVVDDVVYAGSDGGQFRAHDTRTGEVLWRRRVLLPDPVSERTSVNNNAFTTPAVTNGTVFTGNANRTMFALDAADGTTRWTMGAGTLIPHAPALGDGLVYVTDKNGTLFCVGSVT